MELKNLITCPKCNHQFNTDQALAQEVETKLRAEFNAKFKEEKGKLSKEAELKESEIKHKFELERKEFEAIRAKLAQEADLKTLEIKQKFEQERLQFENQTKQKIAQDFELQLKSSTEELEKKRREVAELRTKELALIQKEQDLIERQQNAELASKRQLLEERKAIEESAKKKAEEESQMKLREKDMKLEQVMQQLEVMKKKAEQGSMQLQGEVQEMALEEMLRASFPFDTISEVGKGVKGADVIQHVRNKFGQECGTIIYESKRTKSFTNEWIDKLKQDLRGQKSDLAVIVTEVMPKEMDSFGLKDGIWICTFAEARGVATVLRESLIRVTEIRASQENRGDKMQLLYDFLTGNEFKQHIEAIVEGFTSMQEGLLKEKMQMEKIWKEREKQIEKVLINTSGMYGSIKGIAGNAIGTVARLELGE